jgi:hypothetical protein
MVYRIRYINENTNMTTLKAINKFVDTFFTENNLETAKTMWSSDATQKALKTVLNKAEKGTKEKDPNAPKRGKSAYLYFCNMNRDTARKALGPDAKATEVTSKLGAMWNQLKNDKKRSAELSKYEKMAADDKERYEKDRAEYVPPEHLGVKKAKTGPKRGKSAYLYFCEAKRDEVRKTLGADAKAADVTRKLGEMWNKLKSQNKTGEYDKLAEADKERYYSEKEAMAMAAAGDAEQEAKEAAAPAKKAPVKKPTPAKGGKAAPVKKAAPAKGGKAAPAKKAVK